MLSLQFYWCHHHRHLNHLMGNHELPSSNGLNLLCSKAWNTCINGFNCCLAIFFSPKNVSIPISWLLLNQLKRIHTVFFLFFVYLIWFSTSQSTIFSVMSGRVFLGWTSTKQGLMCLAQGHNTLTPVRLEPAILQSPVKHSTTKPLGSLFLFC